MWTRVERCTSTTSGGSLQVRSTWDAHKMGTFLSPTNTHTHTLCRYLTSRCWLCCRCGLQCEATPASWTSLGRPVAALISACSETVTRHGPAAAGPGSAWAAMASPAKVSPAGEEIDLFIFFKGKLLILFTSFALLCSLSLLF